MRKHLFIFLFSFLALLPAIVLGNDVYVTVNGAGNASGLSWENAMSSDDFANLLSTAANGTTFHMAEGVYKPIIAKEDPAIPSYVDFTYEINSSVSIIGGYPANATTGSLPNPGMYTTIFSGEKSEGDYIYNFLFRTNGNTTVSFQGVTFYRSNRGGIYINNSNVFFDQCIFERTIHAMYSYIACKININNSETKMSTISVYQGSAEVEINNSILYGLGSAITFTSKDANSLGKLTVNNSTFNNNSVRGIDALYTNVYVSGCTFYNNKQDIVSCMYGYLSFKNNTVYDSNYRYTNTTRSSFYVNTDCEIVHNTIIKYNNTTDLPFFDFSRPTLNNRQVNISVTGNIIAYNNNLSATVNSNANVTFDHNLLTQNSLTGITNKVLTDLSLFAQILDGTFSNGIFIPNLQNNGGSTSTIALTSANIPNGLGSLRYVPSSLTDVTTDQRGETREDPACIGAFELAQTFLLDYYVKVNGTGTGASWEDAMSPNDFANLLSVVPDNTTFHMAEGVYKPIIAKEDPAIPSYVDFTYEINSSVSIIGGYPANATTGSLPNPGIYTTIFSGEKNEGDYINNYIFQTNGNTTVSFQGVTFYRSSRGGIYVNNSTIFFDQCIFERTILAVYSEIACKININNSETKMSTIDLYGAPAEVEINNSILNGLGSAIGFINLDANLLGKLTVNNTTFNDNSVRGIDALNTNIYVNGCTFYNNKQDIVSCMNGYLSFKNNTVYDSKYRYTNTTRSSFYVNTDCEIVHNTIIKYNNTTDLPFFDFSRPTLNNRQVNISVTGNIIVYNNNLSATVNSNANVTFDYNLLTQNSITGTTNKVLTDLSLFDQILDGTFSNGIFIPNLQNNGGSTATIALTSANIPNGLGSLRYVPSNLTGVTTDQRGETREDPACIGAFEFVQTFLPDYYVSQYGMGMRDGSSWMDAMAAEDFAAILSTVPDNTTFYLEEGQYMLDDSNEINSSITIIGSYPQYANEQSEPDFVNYRTIFSRNTNGNFNNPDDPDNFILNIQGNNNINIQGITFESYNWSAFLSAIYTENSNLEIDNCKFEENLRYGIYHNGNADISVTDSRFSYLTTAVFFRNLDYNTARNLEIAGTLFNECRTGIITSNTHLTVSKCSFRDVLENILESADDVFSFTNNTVADTEVRNGSFLMWNSSGEIIHNTIVRYIWDETPVFYISSITDRIKITGNIIVSNGPIVKDGFWQDIESDFNLLSSNISYSGYDIILNNIFDLSSIMNGMYQNNMFFPMILPDNYIELTGTFVAGNDIRMVPTFVTNIYEDQRGAHRYNSACMGSYEYGSYAFAKQFSEIDEENAGKETANVQIFNIPNGICIKTTEASGISVYSMTGSLIRQMQVTGDENITLPQGVYILKVNDTFKKVLVK